MLYVSTWWQSTAQHSDPLNHALLLSTFLSPLIPYLHSPFSPSNSPLPHATFQPPFSFSSSSSSSCQAFVLLCCSDTFLKHAEEREKGKTEGERMERRRKKRGKVRDKSAGHFLSHCCGERESESAKRERESWEIKGKQKVTEMERLRHSERMKATNVKRDSSVFGGVKSISFLLRCQLYFSHPHFLIFQLFCGRILFTSFVLSSSSFRFRSYQEPCW